MGEEVVEEEEETLEAISESEPSKYKKKGKDKKAFNPLADNIKFKKIDFEHALTPEEKAAKKAEKEAKKKGKGKPKREKPQPEPISTAVTEEQEAQVEETETIVTQEETSMQVEKVKDKKGKKEKGKEKTKEGKKEKKVVETAKKVDGEEENEEEEIEEKVAIDEEKKGKKKQKVGKPEKVPKEKAKKEKKEKLEGEEKPKKEKKKKKEKQVISAISVTEEVEEAETKPKKEKKGKKGKGKGKKGKRAPIEEEVEEEEEEIIKPVEVPSDDEWSWYSCSCSEGEEEEKVEEEEEKIKKGKKGKKEKEKKKKKKTEVQEKEKVEEPVPEDDIFEEIRKMQAAAMGQLEEAEVAEEAPPPKKEKKKKPKKEKKPKKVKEVKMTEAMRKQMEEEAKRLAEEERLRAEEERRALIAKEKKEQLDHVLRMEQLANSVTLQKQISEHNLQLFFTVRDHAEWDHYIRCDGLPFALDIPKMNTYLDFWKKYIPKTDIKTTTQRTKDVLKLLEFLEEYIEFPLDASPKKIENWKWIRSQCREVQQRNMDSLGCYVLKNIKERMTRISVPMAVFSQSEDDFILCLNALVPLPTPMPNPRRPPPKRLDINLTQLNVRLLFPENVTCYLLAIRAMYLKFDHLTDTSSTFVEPELPEIYKKDLKETTFLEFYQKLYYKFVNRVIPPPKQLEEGEEPPKEPEVDVEKGIVPTVPFQKLEPSASEYFLSMEDDVYNEALKSLQFKLAPDVINLRKYSVMGGLFFINLFYQPPQPKELPNLEIIITLVTNPECLVEYPFYVNYVPPPTPGPGVIRSPEEIEEEMKKQEQEMDKLVFVNMDLPNHVLWLDPPTVCRWNYAEKQWVNKDVHDVKYVEEKATISFRIGKFGTFGLAVNKHCNLPYQTWEIKPEKDGSISLQITAAILFIEFNVNGKLVCVSKLQNSPTSAMKEHIGVYYKLTKLIRILKQGGIDFFPGHDAFLYVEGGHCQKHWPTEKHLYYNIAEIAGVFNIAWSRWNIFAGRRNIIFQVRDYDVDKVKQVPFSLVLVNPLNAIYIDCTEVSPTLVLEPIEGMKFYSDLFYLIRATSRMSTRTKIQNTALDVVGTLAELITATRIFSWA